MGAVIRIEGRDLFLPIKKIGGLAQGRMTFEGRRVDLRRFERRPGELLLAEDLLARHLINLVRGRIIIANEIEIAADRRAAGRSWASTPGDVRFCAAYSATRSARTCRPRPSWTSPQSSPSSPTCRRARLRIPYRKLAKLHPAQIADLVEQASHEEGEEIIEAVGLDRELEADVFEELDTTHQLEFLESRSDAEAARLLSRMEPDNAADLITEIDQERRLPILSCCRASSRPRFANFSRTTPTRRAGLMNPDFVSVPPTATVADALEAIRTSRVPAESLQAVFVVDDERPADRRGVHRAAGARPARANSPSASRAPSSPTCTRTGTCCACRGR